MEKQKELIEKLAAIVLCLHIAQLFLSQLNILRTEKRAKDMWDCSKMVKKMYPRWFKICVLISVGIITVLISIWAFTPSGNIWISLICFAFAIIGFFYCKIMR